MKNTNPQFLSNEPLGEDLFEGKSQERTAEIICSIIKDEKFQVIGIDGSWGSGKSNLVKIIEKETHKKEKDEVNKSYFFIYDVWGHQEDDQRRAILEELTIKLTDKGSSIIKDHDKWKRKLKVLLSKEKETITKKKPVLSLGIVLSLVSLLVIPLTNAIANDINDRFYKYLFYSIPLIILFLAYYNNLVNLISAKGYFKCWMLKISWLRLFELYQKDKIENTTYESISEDEPSVRKFRDWMKNIDKDLKPNSLVIVFDNFDRLPDTKIRDLWSSINIFFSEEKYQQIKVIIPFDREHIKKAFEDLGNEKYSEDYINKTFDIVYRVSKPILSNWKEFFKTKWIEAFGDDFDISEYNRVIQIYDIFNPENTPREIIAFINEIVSLKLLFQDEIPLRYMAIFILNKEELLENYQSILEPTFLKHLSNIYSNDDELTKYLTALVYQLNPKEALDIVYSTFITKSLNLKDIEGLKSISKLPNFVQILDTVYPNISNIGNAIIALDGLDKDCFGGKEKESIVWTDLCNKLRINYIIDYKVEEHQKILLNRLDFDYKIIWLQKIIHDYYEIREFNSKTFSKSIDSLDSFLKENKLDINIFDYLKEYETKIEDFTDFLKYKKSNFSDYKIETDFEVLDYNLSEIEDISKFEDIEYIPYLKGYYDFDEYQNNLKEKIKNNTSNVRSESILFKRLKEVQKETIKIEKLLTDTQIYSLFNSSGTNDDFYYDLIAMRLSRLTEFDYPNYFQQVLKSNDVDVAEKVSKTIEYYIGLDDFLIGIEEFNDSPLYKKIAQNLVEKSYGASKTNIIPILNKFDSICKQASINGYKLINRLDNWKGSDFTVKDIENIPDYFFNYSSNSSTSLAKKCNELKIESFRKLSKEEWIKTYSNVHSGSFSIIEALKYNEFTKNQLDAFKDVMLSRVNISISFFDQAKYDVLINKMLEIDKKFIGNLFSEIKDKFISTGYMNVSLFNYFGRWLFQFSKLNNLGQDFEKIFPSDILSDGTSINILIEYKKEFKSILKTSIKDDFIKTLKKKAKKTQRVRNLATELGIKIGLF